MSEPFLGEIRMFAGTFAPKGWATCDGQLLAIQSNTALFSLLGTFYGGNGTTTFALPNLKDRVPIHWGQGPGLTNRDLGEMAGSATVNLVTSEMAQHSHAPLAVTGAGALDPPTNAYWSASSARDKQFAAGAVAPDVTMGNLLDPVGGSQPHNNQFPYLVVTYIIATSGIFPSRS